MEVMALLEKDRQEREEKGLAGQGDGETAGDEE